MAVDTDVVDSYIMGSNETVPAVTDVANAMCSVQILDSMPVDIVVHALDHDDVDIVPGIILVVIIVAA